MPHRIFTTSEKAWQGMLTAIMAAQKSIYFEMYIFSEDTTGYNFLGELEKAAQRGLKVIAIFDVLGSHALGREAIARLKAAGVEVLFYSFFFRRTHRKILIIDEKTAFVGGVNIHKEFRSWKDLQIRVSGRIVRSVLRSFSRVYHECGGKAKLLGDIKPKSIFSRAKTWFLEKGIGRNRHLMKKYYGERIDHAEQSIVLITPYLLPPRWLVAHIHQALIRGVKVDILLPHATDHRLANIINRLYAVFFSNLGARCHFSDGMNHAKAMLIDNREGLIGSQNLDPLSMEWNIEAGIFFSEKDTVQRFSKIVEKWIGESRLFDANGVDHKWYDCLVRYL